jgi:hypothetical protein
MSEVFYFPNPKCKLPFLGKNLHCFQEFEMYVLVTLAVRNKGDQLPPPPAPLGYATVRISLNNSL